MGAEVLKHQKEVSWAWQCMVPAGAREEPGQGLSTLGQRSEGGDDGREGRK